MIKYQLASIQDISLYMRLRMLEEQSLKELLLI
uniref:Uncharacterized protein n=1 Tax=Podoviridae sp. ctZkC8 TaxID=2825259 RepID=A0A8S5UC09_9CAUD|nr:MAG TPA: hypothetical protein [Podoviridae sp. ctZkC8]